jgi:NAD(P)-dependent dehydrogenase (short-subunit alcohol dehydrogenase family)
MTSGALAGRVALVTGASAGIGAAIARRLAAAGAHVVLVARGRERLAAVADGLGDRASAEPADVCDPADADRVVAATVHRHGRLDVLVNNAGGNLAPLGPLFAAAPDDALAMFRLNVLAPVIWARAAWQASMAARGGVVLNVSSLSARRGSVGTGLYAVTKAALDRATSQLAWELGPQVRVVGVAPGMTSTELTESLVRKLGPVLHEHVPAGRIGTTADVAELALFLVSDAASWISGVTVPLDGGELASPLGASLPMPASPRPERPPASRARNNAPARRDRNTPG